MSNETLKIAHAPGPWEMEVLGNTLRVIDFDGNDIVLVGNCMDERKQANAKLIAAAPELLKALKDLLKDYKETDFDTVGKSELLIIRAEAAILKATT